MRLLFALLCLGCALPLAAARPADSASAGAAAAAASRSSAQALLDGGQVQRLDQAIARYRAVADNGGWLPLNPAVALVPGVRHPEVRILRQRLRLTGDFDAEVNADPLFFDATLRAAVVAFQQRNGIYANGRIGTQTRNLLNQPVEQRIAQLEQARAAWREVTADSSHRRVWVNIPEAAAAAIARGRVELHMRAVVGHASRPTPELTSEIRRIIVNPSWTVPPRIAGEDLAPRQAADPDYLRARGFRLYAGWQSDSAELDPRDVDWAGLDPQRFPYRLTQLPGPSNSLGRFKFEFPNAHDVYLHDTPVQALLGLTDRSLSSGCVRVAQPDALARWLAADEVAAINAAAGDASWGTRAFPLDEAVPVEIVYLSAWVSADGRVQFRRDVYGHTQAAESARLTAAQ